MPQQVVVDEALWVPVYCSCGDGVLLVANRCLALPVRLVTRVLLYDALVVMVGQVADDGSFRVEIEVLTWQFVDRFCIGRLAENVRKERHKGIRLAVTLLLHLRPGRHVRRMKPVHVGQVTPTAAQPSHLCRHDSLLRECTAQERRLLDRTVVDGGGSRAHRRGFEHGGSGGLLHGDRLDDVRGGSLALREHGLRTRLLPQVGEGFVLSLLLDAPSTLETDLVEGASLWGLVASLLLQAVQHRVGLTLAAAENGLQAVLRLLLRRLRTPHQLPLCDLVKLTLPLPLLLHDKMPAERCHLASLQLLLLHWD